MSSTATRLPARAANCRLLALRGRDASTKLGSIISMIFYFVANLDFVRGKVSLVVWVSNERLQID